MIVDFDRRLVFPDIMIIQTNFRPDILLWTHQGKTMMIMELTVPGEDRCEEAYQQKKGKYVSLAAEDVIGLGWNVWVLPVEMG